MGKNLAFEAQTPCQDEPWPDYLAVSTKEPSALNSAEAVWKCLFLFLHPSVESEAGHKSDQADLRSAKLAA